MVGIKKPGGWTITAIVTLILVASIYFLIPARVPDVCHTLQQKYVSHPLYGERKVGQTFRTNRDRFSSVEVYIDPLKLKYKGYHALMLTLGIRKFSDLEPENREEIIFHLKDSPAAAEDLVTLRARIVDVMPHQKYRFEFDPIEDSKGRHFYFELESPGSTEANSVGIRLSPWRDLFPYKDGRIFYDGRRQPKGTPPDQLREISFRTYSDLGRVEYVRSTAHRLSRGRPAFLSPAFFMILPLFVLGSGVALIVTLFRSAYPR